MVACDAMLNVRDVLRIEAYKFKVISHYSLPLFCQNLAKLQFY